MPLPGDDTLPDTDDNPLLGSGLSFLKAPSAEIRNENLRLFGKVFGEFVKVNKLSLWFFR